MRALAAATSVLDGRRSAKLARLRYVTDEGPGIRRERRGRGVRYIGPAGSPVRNIAVLRRIKRLAIPPAWTDVWICADPHGHLQAVGRDASGRRQYRYHARWRQVRDEAKYEPHDRVRHGRCRGSGAAWRATSRCRACRGEKVLATVVRLLETTLIRVGNEEYAQGQQSVRAHHALDRASQGRGRELHLEFQGQGRQAPVRGWLRPARGAIVRRCQDLPGHELFQYLGEDGRRHTVGLERRQHIPPRPRG